MTTDVKFLEKQQSQLGELREHLEKSVDGGIIKKEKFEKSSLELDVNNFPNNNVDIDIAAEIDKPTIMHIEEEDIDVSFDSDMEEDLEDGDFLDDEEDYCDLNDILTQDTDNASIETGIVEEVVIKNDNESKVLNSKAEVAAVVNTAAAADDDYEDYDYDFMEDENDYVDSDSLDINQILKRYSNVIHTSEHEIEEAIVKKVEVNCEKDKITVSTGKEETSFVEKDDKQTTEPTENKPAKNKRFTCDKCNRNFTQNKSLKEHDLLHTGEKPHKCNQCEECFRLKSQMNKHMQSHNSF